MAFIRKIRLKPQRSQFVLRILWNRAAKTILKDQNYYPRCPKYGQRVRMAHYLARQYEKGWTKGWQYVNWRNYYQRTA